MVRKLLVVLVPWGIILFLAIGLRDVHRFLVRDECWSRCFITVVAFSLVILLPAQLCKLFVIYSYSQFNRLYSLTDMLNSPRQGTRKFAITVLSWIAGDRYGTYPWSIAKLELQSRQWKEWLDKNRHHLRWDERTDRIVEA
jgi:hypothetical protein